jgi:hypothetical protein
MFLAEECELLTLHEVEPVEVIKSCTVLLSNYIHRYKWEYNELSYATCE